MVQTAHLECNHGTVQTQCTLPHLAALGHRCRALLVACRLQNYRTGAAAANLMNMPLVQQLTAVKTFCPSDGMDGTFC